MNGVKLALKLILIGLVALVLIGAGVFAWASATTARSLGRTIDTHSVDFPVPFPVPTDEVQELGLAQDEAEELAMERALERGRHLVNARYPCGECHGSDFGGGVMVDAFPIGRLLGPNLTAGQGGVTSGYTTADWDRIVRHGVLPDGRPAVMPSEDFLRMSDQELSDIIVYLGSVPPVDNEVPGVKLGPLGRFLVAREEIVLSADLIESHHAAHPEFPPPPEVSIEFGRHLAGVCTGCHGTQLNGGRIAGGDPSWPPAANLTPDESGLAGWSYQDFRAAMLDGRRPDGSEIGEPMSAVTPFARNMTDVEMEALWVYLESLPLRPMP